MSHLTDLPEAPADPRPKVPRWVTEIGIGAVVLVLAFAHPPFPYFQTTGPVTTALMLAPIAILPFRHRWPVPVLIVLLGLFGATAAAGTLSIGVGIAVGVAMFQVSFRGPRTRALLIGGAAVVAIILLTLPAAIGSVIDPRVFQFGLIVAFAAAAGDGARSRIAYIAAITDRAERAVQTREAEARRRVSEERLRIARDLHDTVAHQIAVISLSAGVASSTIDTHPDKAKESMVTIRTAARTVLSEIGDLLAMLRADDDSEGAETPQTGLDHLDDLVAQFADAGLEVTTRIEGDLNRASGVVGLVAYRVIQEALTNAHKHGFEGRAHVLVAVGETDVVISVTNPLRDEPADAHGETSSGLGLIGVRERVASVRGTVEAGRAPGGWKVVASVPLAKETS
ncbi:sensor histidine kinase [Microbacterium sp. NPDC087591]|uniref:sensor histidine kinase n=1 Tax=Microbacterium sp. NPDC087591 TaxID=3364192 RepID=UPI003821912B